MQIDKLVLIVASFISMSSCTYHDIHECTKSAAFKNGMLAIKERYPNSWNRFQPYKIESHDEDSLVILGSTSKEVLGGTPEIIVSKEKCQIESIYHTQ